MKGPNEFCIAEATSSNGDAYNGSRLVWSEVSDVAFDNTFERRAATYNATKDAVSASVATTQEERHAP